MTIGLVFRVSLTVLLVRVISINIFGAIIANIVFLGITLLMLAVYIRRKVELDYKLMQELIYPILIGGVVLAGMTLLHSGLSLVVNYFVSMVITIVVGFAVYIIWVFFSKVFTRKEKFDFFVKHSKKIKSKSHTCQIGQKNP